VHVVVQQVSRCKEPGEEDREIDEHHAPCHQSHVYGCAVLIRRSALLINFDSPGLDCFELQQKNSETHRKQKRGAST
jgi:hypothetical protein